MEPNNNLRIVSDRRHLQRRKVVPDSLKPFLGWLIAEERRLNERRSEERRQLAYSL
jgi:hypothetical protein